MEKGLELTGSREEAELQEYRAEGRSLGNAREVEKLPF
jgi:hypothetical protein